MKEESKDKLKKHWATPFIMVPKEFIDNPKISMGAKAFFTYLIGRPDDWEFWFWEIQNHFKEKRDKLRSARKELIDLGYLKVTQTRDGGRYGASLYEIYISPQTKPETDIPAPVNTAPDLTSPIDPPITNKEYTNKEYTNIDYNNIYITQSAPASKKVKNSESKSATRINPSWQLTDQLLESAHTIANQHNINLVDNDIYIIAGTFKDYWLSKLGKTAEKADWDATFRNWVRNDLSRRREKTEPRVVVHRKQGGFCEEEALASLKSAKEKVYGNVIIDMQDNGDKIWT